MTDDTKITGPGFDPKSIDRAIATAIDRGDAAPAGPFYHRDRVVFLRPVETGVGTMTLSGPICQVSHFVSGDEIVRLLNRGHMPPVLGEEAIAKAGEQRDALHARLTRIKEIIEHVDHRAMAADGPVTPTLQEMTQAEISEIYRLAGGVPGE